MAFDLDRFDVNILKELQSNARLSIKEISNRVYLSANAVSSRIIRMEVGGCIKQYITILNKSMVGRNLECFTGVSLAQNNKENLVYFTDCMKKVPEIYNYYHVNGMFDFLLHIVARDMQDYHNILVNTLSKTNCIYRVNTFFVLSEMEGGHKIDLSHLSQNSN